MDRNSFSIIIPMTGDEQAFDATLASVLRSQSANCQIIVAHDGSYTDPYDLRREVTFVQSTDGSDSMAALLNAAIPSSTCSLTAIVKPGSELPEGWNASVARAFDDPSVGSVSVPVVHAERPDRIATGGVILGAGLNRKLAGAGQRMKKRSTKKLRPLGPTLWAGFYRTSLLQTVAPLCDQMEACYLDVDIALTARTLDLSCRWLPEVVVNHDQPKAIQTEANRPHGRSAQRATRRHGLNAGIASRVTNAGFELLSSPLFPNMLPHAIGRLFSGHAQTDTDFHQQVIDSASDLTQQASTRLSTRRHSPAGPSRCVVSRAESAQTQTGILRGRATRLGNLIPATATPQFLDSALRACTLAR